MPQFQRNAVDAERACYRGWRISPAREWRQFRLCWKKRMRTFPISIE